MLSLTNGLSKKFKTEIGNLPIDLSFNQVINWYRIAEMSDITDASKIRSGWSIFFSDEIDFNDVDDYVIAMKVLKDVTDYVSADPYNDIQDDAEDSNSKPTKWLSYVEDAEAIYASFMFDYNIDLLEEQNKMRWEKFRALFNNLSPKSPIMRIVDIRMADPADYEGKSLASLINSQNYYSLEGQSVEKLNQNIGDMFSMIKNSIPKD